MPTLNNLQSEVDKEGTLRAGLKVSTKTVRKWFRWLFHSKEYNKRLRKRGITGD